jgi:hypothetical protein
MAHEQDVIDVASVPEHELVVIHPFESYQRGDRISDALEVARIKQSENHHHVHKVIPQ